MWDDEPIFNRDEYYEETEYEKECYRQKIVEEAKMQIWTTKSGEKLSLSEMSISHIKNALKILIKNNVEDINLPWITVMQEELKKRGIANEKD